MKIRKRNYIVPIFVVIIGIAIVVLLCELMWGVNHKPIGEEDRGEKVVMEYLQQKYHEDFYIFNSYGPNFMDTDRIYDVSVRSGKYKDISFEVTADEKDPSVKSCQDTYVNYLFQEPYTEYCKRIVSKYINKSIVLVEIGGRYGIRITGQERGRDMVSVAQSYVDIIVNDTKESEDNYRKIMDEIGKEIDDLHGHCMIKIRCLNDEYMECLNKDIRTKDEYEEALGGLKDNDCRYKWII